MKHLALGLAITVAAAGSAAAGQAVLSQGTVLRAGPSTLYGTVAHAGAGTRVTTLGGGWAADSGSNVTVIESTMGWTMVRLPNGATGWVANGTLGSGRVVASAPRPAAPVTVAAAPAPIPAPPARPEVEPVDTYTSVVWPSAGALNLREGPGLDHVVVSRMEQGDFVAVTAKAGPWVKVQHESGAEGWAHSDYLTR